MSQWKIKLPLAHEWGTCRNPVCGVESRCLYKTTQMCTGKPLCCCDMVPALAVTRCQGTVLSKLCGSSAVRKKIFPLCFLEQEALHETVEKLYSAVGGQHRRESSAETEMCEHAGVTEGKHLRGQRAPGSGQVCGAWPSWPLPDLCEQRAAGAAVAEWCRPLWGATLCSRVGSCSTARGSSLCSRAWCVYRDFPTISLLIISFFFF